MSNTIPEWLRVGAELVVYSRARYGTGGTIHKVTVTKIGKRDIVLDRGKRFNLNNFRRYPEDSIYNPGPSSFSPTSHLTYPGNPVVAEIKQGNRLNRAKSAVDGAFESWRRDREDSAALDALIASAIELRDITTEGMAD